MVVERTRVSGSRSGAGMGTTVNLFQMTHADMSIALRSGETRMAEHLLNRAQVGAGVEQMRREAVAQTMRRQGRLEAGNGQPALEHLLHGARGQTPAAQIGDDWVIW